MCLPHFRHVTTLFLRTLEKFRTHFFKWFKKAFICRVFFVYLDIWRLVFFRFGNRLHFFRRFWRFLPDWFSRPDYHWRHGSNRRRAISLTRRHYWFYHSCFSLLSSHFRWP